MDFLKELFGGSGEDLQVSNFAGGGSLQVAGGAVGGGGDVGAGPINETGEGISGHQESYCES